MQKPSLTFDLTTMMRFWTLSRCYEETSDLGTFARADCLPPAGGTRIRGARQILRWPHDSCLLALMPLYHPCPRVPEPDL